MPQRIEVPGMGVVEFPDGMTDAQIEGAIKANSAPQGPKAGAGSRFLSGLADPIHGGAQLLTNMLPKDVVETGNRLNNWLAEKTGLVGKLPTGGVDQMVRQREADYQAQRGEDGFDWARLAGNIASPMNMGPAALGTAASLGGRIALGAGTGAMSGAMAPATGSDDFADEKLKQIGLGAGVGGAVPGLAAGLGRLIAPKAASNPQLALLQSEGVRPTIGQTLGGTAARLEEKAMSMPFLGDSIRTARRSAETDLNKAVAARALAPIGEKPAEGVVGRELVADAQKKLSDAYEALLPKLNWRPDGQFAQQVMNLRQMVQTGAIKTDARDAFERILQGEVVSKMGAQNAMTGKTFKGVESNLTQTIGRLQQSTDADQRLVSDALKELRSAMRDALTRSNPQAKELADINKGWANFKRLERASSYLGTEEGAFSAPQLLSAVKALDRSKDKGKFARGDAFMQDLGDAAKSVLGNKTPDSGTAGRLAQMAALGSGMHNPMIPAALMGGAGLYTQPMQSLLRAAVTSRPQAAQPIAGLLNQASPMFGPAGGLLALEAFQ